ncbi:type II secretion system F family protein [Flagellatimonas centrodinii]|uniref:type II secretion system F family protein n=1 Tax=Flagellatimonas centrodinii TaxID=2806210 RepID=UPI001FEDC0B1|nr:type II secretion system F family protein [Flagellatimonas centrodinii]ULQ45353.1 type II secretion system F family protein [Flagellatimonas centrodinii]
MNFYGAIVLVVLMLAGAAALLFLRASARERQSALQLRVRALGGEDTAALVAAFRPRADAIRNPLTRWVCTLLWRSGSEADPASVNRVLLAVVLIGLPLLLLIFGWMAGIAIAGFIIVMAWAWLSRKAATRRAVLLEQLPNYLESVIRVLSAGNTLEESLSIAARESSEPLQPLMISVGRQVRLGAPVDAVLMETAEIHKLNDVKVMALAAAINRKYGGSLRNILRSLVQAIRARDVAARELRALTAETRFSAVVLSVLPIGISLYVYLQNPAYYTDILQDPGGRAMMLGSLLMQLAGIVVLVRMMRSTEQP